MALCHSSHIYHCIKSVQIRSYFWSVFSCIRTEYRKTRTRNNFVFRHFLCSVCDLKERRERRFKKTSYGKGSNRGREGLAGEEADNSKHHAIS